MESKCSNFIPQHRFQYKPIFTNYFSLVLLIPYASTFSFIMNFTTFCYFVIFRFTSSGVCPLYPFGGSCEVVFDATLIIFTYGYVGNLSRFTFLVTMYLDNCIDGLLLLGVKQTFVLYIIVVMLFGILVQCMIIIIC